MSNDHDAALQRRTSVTILVLAASCLVAASAGAQSPAEARAGMEQLQDVRDLRGQVEDVRAQRSAAGGGGGLANVITVSAKGGKFKTISSALASIKDASATNLYVVQVGPGTYSEHVVMKPYVTVVGAGRAETWIKAAGGTTRATAAVVRAADPSFIQSLTIQHTGGGPYAVGIYAASTEDVFLDDVRVLAAGGTSETRGIASSSQVVLEDSNVSVSGSSGSAIGIDLQAPGAVVALYRSGSSALGAGSMGLYLAGTGSAVYMENSSFSGETGLHLSVGSLALVNTSSISGSTAIRCVGCTGVATFTQLSGTGSTGRGLAISQGAFRIVGGYVQAFAATIAAAPGSTATAAHTALMGGAAGGGGVIRCAGVSDENLAFYANTCP
jgi:pectinesterase